MDLFSLKGVNKSIKMLLIFLMGMNIATGLFVPILAVFVTDKIVGATLMTVGIAIAISAIAKSVIQIPIAKILDRRAGERDDFISIIMGVVLTIIYFGGLMFTHNVWQLYILQIFDGISNAFLFAAYYAIFAHHIDRNSEGFEWSLLSVLGLTLSTGAGGIIGGYIAETYGFTSLLSIAVLINVLALVFILILFPTMLVMRKKDEIRKITHSKRHHIE